MAAAFRYVQSGLLGKHVRSEIIVPYARMEK